MGCGSWHSQYTLRDVMGLGVGTSTKLCRIFCMWEGGKRRYKLYPVLNCENM